MAIVDCKSILSLLPDGYYCMVLSIAYLCIHVCVETVFQERNRTRE